MIYPIFQARELLKSYWDLWLTPGLDFEIIWLYRPIGGNHHG